VATVLSGAPASAAPVQSGPESAQRFQFDERAIKAVTRSAGSVTAAAAVGRVRSHLDDSARRGRLIDKSSMSVAELPDPFTAGETIAVVWDGPKSPTKVYYSRMEAETGKGHAVGIGLQMGDGDATTMPTVRTRSARTGAGYAGGSDSGNMYLEDNGCSTAFQTPSYPYSGEAHKMVSCYEAWGLDQTPIWVYNRWSSFYKATPTSGVSATTIDM
jgi:hypothetical protein